MLAQQKINALKKLQVKKANFLVPLEEAVSKPAQLLASYLVAYLPKSRIGVDDFPTLQFSYEELKSAINADGKERVNKIKDIFQLGVELQRCVLFHSDENTRKKKTVTWLIENEHDEVANVFTYRLHSGLKKYLLNLENHFTKYNYLFRVSLNAHAMKLYEILKSYQYLGQVTIHIENDLKPSLGLVGKYDKVYDFKRRVLIVAQKEFVKYTDIQFEFEPAEKKGKTPISYRFYIYKNSPTDLPEAILNKFKNGAGELSGQMSVFELLENKDSSKQFPQTRKQLQDWGGSEKIIDRLILEHGIDKVNYQINHLQRVLKGRSNIGNPFAWFRKALNENYQDSVQDTKQKKTVVKQKLKKQEKAKETFEKEITDIKNAHIKEQFLICNQLIEADKNLLSQAVENEKSNFIISAAIRDDKTPSEIYESSVSKFVVLKEIKQLKPDAFSELDNKYKSKISLLEQKRTQ